MNYIANIHNVYHLWQIQIVQNSDFLPLPMQLQPADLDPMQMAVLHTFQSFLQLREQFYDSLSVHAQPTIVDFDTEEQTNSPDPTTSSSTSHTMNEWLKIISLTGKPGTGKTKCLHSCIDYAINQDLKCLVATPTGFPCLFIPSIVFSRY